MAGQCPFGFDSDTQANDSDMRRVLVEDPSAEKPQFPSQILTCSKTNKTLQTNKTEFDTETYSEIALDVFDQFDKIGIKADQTRYAACLVRLAGHDLMDYRDVGGVMSGGSDGCVNLYDDDNKGLDTCLEESDIQAVYEDYCDQVSLADFIVIAAETVTARTATNYDANQQFTNGTLEAHFRDNFRAGRQTVETCEDSIGLLPDAEAGCTDVKSIFIEHIFGKLKNVRFRWKLTAAISGAHTIGQASIENSGFNGTWSDEANQGIFNNDYYKSLLFKGWAPTQIDEDHHQWKRVDLKDTAVNEMMLSSDLCLAYQHNPQHQACVQQKMVEGMNEQKANGKCKGLQKKGELLNGADVECCAWTNTRALYNTGTFRKESANEYCGASITEPGSFMDARAKCCSNTESLDCDASKWPKGPAFGAMLSFARNEDTWLKFYKQAWLIATTNGQDGLVQTSKFQKKLKMKREKQEKRRQAMMEKRLKREAASKARKAKKNAARKARMNKKGKK